PVLVEDAAGAGDALLDVHLLVQARDHDRDARRPGRGVLRDALRGHALRLSTRPGARQPGRRLRACGSASSTPASTRTRSAARSAGTATSPSGSPPTATR